MKKEEKEKVGEGKKEGGRRIESGGEKSPACLP
jgi:hypothetical protein